MSNEVLEKKQFTQTAVLFSLTGHIFIRSDADDKYYYRSLEEIKEDAVYKHVMSSVPENMRYSLWDMYDASTKDVDPILKKYLCMKLPMLAVEVDNIEKLTVREALKYLERTCLANEYIELKPITFEELTAIAEEVNREVNENANSTNKL